MPVALSNLSATWAASASSVNTAIKMDVTDTSSAANSKLLDLQIDGVSRFDVEKSGNVRANVANVVAIRSNSVLSNTAEIGLVTANTANLVNVNSTTITTSAITTNSVSSNNITSNTLSANVIIVGGISSNTLSLIPTGTIFPYAGSTEPSGYLFCSGNAVSRSVYSELFAAIGTTYGTGDGTTTFNVPDLRGRVIAGRDNMSGVAAGRLTANVAGSVLGNTGGVQTHTMSIDEMPLHGHPTRVSTGSGAGSDISGGMMLDAGADANYVAFTGTPTSTAGQQVGGTGGGQSHNIIQPTIVLNYIIKT